MDYPFIFLYGKNAASKQKNDEMARFIFKFREKRAIFGNKIAG